MKKILTVLTVALVVISFLGAHGQTQMGIIEYIEQDTVVGKKIYSDSTHQYEVFKYAPEKTIGPADPNVSVPYGGDINLEYQGKRYAGMYIFCFQIYCVYEDGTHHYPAIPIAEGAWMKKNYLKSAEDKILKWVEHHCPPKII